jgi:KaiC/GvpD/RAD55 family RecA-like ATPase
MIEFPSTYSALLIGLPGVGKSEYCMQLVKDYLEKGEKVVYVTTEKSPSDIRERIGEMGVDLQGHEGESFLFIDVFTREAGAKEENVLYVDNPSNLNMVSVRLSEAVDTLGKPVRIIFDSLSTFFLHASEKEIRNFFESINTKIKMEKSFAIFALHEEMHDEKVVIALKAMVMSVIEMTVEDGPSRRRKARVAFAKKGVKHSPNWFEFDINKEGIKFTPIEEKTKAKEKPKRGKLFKVVRAVGIILAALILIGIISGGDEDQDISKTGRPVLFYENFDDAKTVEELPAGWKVRFPEKENGMLVSSSSGVFFYAFGDEWENYVFMFSMNFNRAENLNMRALARSTADGAYSIILSSDMIRLEKSVQEEDIELTSAEYEFKPERIYEMRIDVQGEYINVFVDDDHVIGFTDVESPLTLGGVGFETFNSEVYIDEIIVEGLDAVQERPEPKEECPECPPASEWSECVDGTITRETYMCDSTTDFICESLTEEESCQLLMGGMGGLKATISPTVGKTVSGIIEIEANTVPDGTVAVHFLFYPQDVQIGQEMSPEDQLRLMRDYDTQGEDGWGTIIDTSTVDNGVYTIFISASDGTEQDGDGPQNFAVKQVIVEN